MHSAYHKLVGLLANVSAVLVALIFLVMIAEVVGRNLFGYSLPATFEISVFLLVYTAFFAAAAAFGRNAHFKVFDLAGRLSGRSARLVQLVADAATILFLGILGYYGVNLALSQMDQPSAALQIPYGIIYLSMPIFAFTSILLLVMKLFLPLGAINAMFSQDAETEGRLT